MKQKMKLIFLLIILLIICLAFVYKIILSNKQYKIEHDEKIQSEESKNENNTHENSDIGTTKEAKNQKEIFEDYYDKADNIMKSMTLEEKVGQMFLARYPGATSAKNEIKNENPGGYVLFGVDFKNKTKNSVTEELKSNQENSKIKLFLAVDEEGGTVTRVSSYSNFRASKFKSPQALYKNGGIEEVLKDSEEKSNLLKSIGLNMNLAPVVDLPTTTSSFMYQRSLGKGAKETSEYASELIKRMNSDKVVASMKHFPGYGDNVDTHTGIAIDKRAYTDFENSDLLPFISGIQSGCPTILVNHNIVNCMDSSMPASLSKNVHDILREKLKFSGLIITDDLAMDAVKKYVDNGQAAVQAVLAGNDMIISSNFKSQKAEIIKAVNDGVIKEETIDIAVRRIIACKCYYGIIE